MSSSSRRFKIHDCPPWRCRRLVRRHRLHAPPMACIAGPGRPPLLPAGDLKHLRSSVVKKPLAIRQCLPEPQLKWRRGGTSSVTSIRPAPDVLRGWSPALPTWPWTGGCLVWRLTERRQAAAAGGGGEVQPRVHPSVVSSSVPLFLNS